jgi:carbonic anhydrase
MDTQRKSRWAKTTAVLANTVFAVIAMTGSAGAVDFEYSGNTGPGFWGELSPACAGSNPDARQSPIDINQVRYDRRLRPLKLDLLETEIDLINNGHVIEQEYGEGSYLYFADNAYQLSLLQNPSPHITTDSPTGHA